MEIKRVRIGSCLKVCLPVFLALGVVIGGFSMIIMSALPGQVPGTMSIGFFRGLLSVLIYSVFFSVITSGFLTVSAVIYNLVSAKWGGVVVDTEKNGG